MKLVTVLALVAFPLIGTVAVVEGFKYVEQLGYERGVKSSPQTPCYPFVKDATEQADARAQAMVDFAGQTAYQQGVMQTVAAAQQFIVDSCTNDGEITADAQTFVCLKKQEM
jgi:hypothetical protein